MPRKRTTTAAQDLADPVSAGANAILDDPDLDEVPHPHEPVVPVASLPDPEPVPLRTFREWIADRTHRGGFDLLDCRLPSDKVRVEVELERRLYLAWEAAREGVGCVPSNRPVEKGVVQ